MASGLEHANVFVALFVMDGCPACEEFSPRFRRAAEKLQRRNPGLPVGIYDAASPDPSVQAFMNRFDVYATPTMLVLPRGHGVIKIEGAIDSATLDSYLTIAEQVHREG